MPVAHAHPPGRLVSRPVASRHPAALPGISHTPLLHSARSVYARGAAGAAAPASDFQCIGVLQTNPCFAQYPTSTVRGLARALDDMLNPDGSWARRTVYHSFRLLHPYQWSHRFEVFAFAAWACHTIAIILFAPDSVLQFLQFGALGVLQRVRRSSQSDWLHFPHVADSNTPQHSKARQFRQRLIEAQWALVSRRLLAKIRHSYTVSNGF
jgi:hypothetical protein